MRALIVDDELNIRKILRVILEENNLEVNEAATVAESVEASPLHIVAGFAAGLVGAEGKELTVTVTPLAQAALRQPVEVSLLCA